MELHGTSSGSRRRRHAPCYEEVCTVDEGLGGYVTTRTPHSRCPHSPEVHLFETVPKDRKTESLTTVFSLIFLFGTTVAINAHSFLIIFQLPRVKICMAVGLQQHCTR